MVIDQLSLPNFQTETSTLSVLGWIPGVSFGVIWSAGFFFPLFSTHNLLLYFHLRRWIYYPYQSFPFEFSSISGGHIIKWNFSSPKGASVLVLERPHLVLFHSSCDYTLSIKRGKKNKQVSTGALHWLLTHKPVNTLVAQFFFYITVFFFGICKGSFLLDQL